MNLPGAAPLRARRRKSKQPRALVLENLESRQLLAGDFLAAAGLLSSAGLPAYQNPYNAYDTNGDMQFNMADYLTLVRDLRTNGPRVLSAPTTSTTGTTLLGARSEPGTTSAGAEGFVDVNGDGMFTMADIALMRSALRSGASPEPDDLVQVDLLLTDLNGNPLVGNTVNVGQTFVVHFVVTDRRLVEPNPGLANAYIDVTYDASIFTTVANSVATTPQYQEENDQTNTATAGLISNFGASVTLASPWQDGVQLAISPPVEVISIQMQAIAPGSGVFTPMQATDYPVLSFSFQYNALNPALLFVPTDMIEFNPTVTLNAVLVGVAAINDTATVLEDEPTGVLIDVTANDLIEDPPYSAADIELVSVDATSVNGGQVSIVGGQVRYIPAADFFGLDTFTYQIRNAQNHSQIDTGTVTVTVIPVNDPPIPGSNFFSTPLNTSVNIPFSVLLANDEPGPPNESGQMLSIPGAFQNVVGGSVVVDLPNQQFIFTPNVGFTGSASFQYRVEDDGGTANGGVNFAFGTVNISVGTSAEDDSFIVHRNSAEALPVLANDAPTGQIVLESIVTQPSNGSATIVGSQVIYQPNFNFVGMDTFQYQIRNTSDNGFDVGTVTIRVNAPPVANPDAYSVVQNSTNNSLDVLANDVVETGEMKSLVIIVTAPTHGTATIDVGTQRVLYTPNFGYFGPDSFVYRMTDGVTNLNGVQLNADATVSINVTVPPSSVSGQVFIDVDNDGVRDIVPGQPINSELGLAGVRIELTGTAVGNVAIGPLTTYTQADGSYSFGNLQPGTYTITQIQPAGMIDGFTLLDGGIPPQVSGLVVLPNSYTFTLNSFGDLSGFNFAERGLQPQFINVTGGYLASSSQNNLTAQIDLTTGQSQWYAFRGTTAGSGWLAMLEARVQVTTKLVNGVVKIDQVTLQVRDGAGWRGTTFDAASNGNFSVQGINGNIAVVRFNNLPSVYPLIPIANPEPDDAGLIDSFFSSGVGSQL